MANQSFPVTRWSLVAIVGENAASERERAVALEELCRLYWPPIYTFIRSKGASPAEAEDLTQGFFADFLARGDFRKTSPDRGKLRSYLLACVSHFMLNDWRARNRQRRGGGAQILSLDGMPGEEQESGVCLIEPSDEVTPEKIFDRQWALTVLAHVLSELRNRYQEKGQADLFEKLKHTVNVSDSGSVSYADIAVELKMTETAVKVAAHRIRKRYAKLLRETVADTLMAGEDVESELKAMMSSFG